MTKKELQLENIELKRVNSIKDEIIESLRRTIKYECVPSFEIRNLKDQFIETVINLTKNK